MESRSNEVKPVSKKFPEEEKMQEKGNSISGTKGACTMGIRSLPKEKEKRLKRNRSKMITK